MNDREIRRLDQFSRVASFWEASERPQRALAAEGEGAKALAALKVAVADLKAGDASKTEGAGDRSRGTTAKSVLADALHLDLQNVVRTAHNIAENEPGFDGPFAPPKNAGYQALKTSARAYLNVLADAAVVAKFVAHELPADFVQHLTDDLAILEAAEDDQDDGLDQQVTGTAKVSRLIGEGNQAVRTLNTVAHNKFSRLPDELRAWLSASHLERSPQRPAAAKPPGQPGAAAAPTPQA